MSELDNLIERIAELREQVDTWKEVSDVVTQEKDVDDLVLTVEAMVEYIECITNIACTVISEVVAHNIEVGNG
jgi:hypothetical protein